MDNKLYINTIRICIKANKYSFGETMLFDIRCNKVKLVIIALDAGEANKKKVIDKCHFYKVPYIEVLSKDDMKELFYKNISSFGITDENLAIKLSDNLNKGGFEYGK